MSLVLLRVYKLKKKKTVTSNKYFWLRAAKTIDGPYRRPRLSLLTRLLNLFK